MKKKSSLRDLSKSSDMAKTTVAISLREQLDPADTLDRDSLRNTRSMTEPQACEAEAPRTDTSARPQRSTTASARQQEGMAPVDGVATEPPGGPKATVMKLPIAPKTKPVEDAEAVAERERTIKGECFYQLREELFDFGRVTTIHALAPDCAGIGPTQEI
jgi:hypothetical protein